MPDPYKNLGLSLSSPAVSAFAATPDDGADLPATTRAVWVGGAGDLAVRMASGDDVVIPTATGMLPIRVDRILATGTTASGVVALW